MCHCTLIGYVSWPFHLQSFNYGLTGIKSIKSHIWTMAHIHDSMKNICWRTNLLYLTYLSRSSVHCLCGAKQAMAHTLISMPVWNCLFLMSHTPWIGVAIALFCKLQWKQPHYNLKSFINNDKRKKKKKIVLQQHGSTLLSLHQPNWLSTYPASI